MSCCGREPLVSALTVYKVLYDGGHYKSQYQLLAEFVKYIVVEKKLHVVTADEIKIMLQDSFGFDVPVPVVNTAIKKMPFVTKENASYIFKLRDEEISFFVDVKRREEEARDYLKRELLLFAEQFDKRKHYDENELFDALVKFLFDESGERDYQELISSFVLRYEHDNEISPKLRSIREGLILFSGLHYNVTDFGSIKQPLFLYLDMEILFDLVGFNGQIYKQQAEELIKQVNVVNSKNRLISLRYFTETKDNIIKYFGKAQSIVEGNHSGVYQTAMSAIINGCSGPSDVVERKLGFFEQLKHDFGIQLDSRDDYYNSENNEYNIEGIDIGEYNTAIGHEESLRYISHINKLRKGDNYSKDITGVRYLFVTRTGLTLRINVLLAELEEAKEGLFYVRHSIYLNTLVNVLWFKTQKNFGSNNTFPISVDAVLKAKIVLANYIKKDVDVAYEKISEQYKNGEIDKDRMIDEVNELRNKPVNPDMITFETLQDDLDFSDDRLNRTRVMYEQASASNKEKDVEIKEKDEEIEKLNQKVESLTKINDEQNKDLKLMRDLKYYLKLFLYFAKWIIGSLLVSYCIKFVVKSYCSEYTMYYWMGSMNELMSILGIISGYVFGHMPKNKKIEF